MARLPGHQLRFHKVSLKDGSAKCDAFYTANENDEVYGVLYAISPEHLDALDAFEGQGAGYERRTIQVNSESGEFVNVQTYFATKIDPALLPFDWYKEHVLRGARENELPEIYVSRIEGISADTDRDIKRRSRELSIYGG